MHLKNLSAGCDCHSDRLALNFSFIFKAGFQEIINSSISSYFNPDIDNIFSKPNFGKNLSYFLLESLSSGIAINSLFFVNKHTVQDTCIMYPNYIFSQKIYPMKLGCKLFSSGSKASHKTLFKGSSLHPQGTYTNQFY